MKPKKKYKKEFLQKFLTNTKNTETNTIKINNNINVIPMKNLVLENEQNPIYVNKRLNTDDLLAIREKHLKMQAQNKKDFTQREKERLKQIQIKQKNNITHNKSKSNRIFLPLTTKTYKSKCITKHSFQSAKSTEYKGTKANNENINNKNQKQNNSTNKFRHIASIKITKCPGAIKNNNVFGSFASKQNTSQNKMGKNNEKKKLHLNVRTYFTEQSKSIEQGQPGNKIIFDKEDNESFRKNYTEANNSKIAKLEFIKNKYKILF